MAAAVAVRVLAHLAQLVGQAAAVAAAIPADQVVPDRKAATVVQGNQVEYFVAVAVAVPLLMAAGLALVITVVMVRPPLLRDRR